MKKLPFKLIDLTHELRHEIPTWSGGCGFEHDLKQDYDLMAPYKFRTHKIYMEEGIGTHMDAPAHCFVGGKNIQEISIQDFFAPCVILDISPKIHPQYSLSTQDIKAFEDRFGKIQEGSFVMVYTGWEKFWHEPEKYRNNLMFPNVSSNAAELLLERKIVGLGIDTLSPDRAEEGFPVHQLILGAGRYIVENVANAISMPSVGGYSLALPLKIRNGTESPIRLVGFVNAPEI
ncbi:MAG: cyclase family protein [Proteobacteria bacterium]|nr:cyclase family protein [Pseudomonadota bacterium]